MLKIGIAGVGFMGMVHYLSYQKLRGVKVAAICDPAPKRRAGDWRGIRGNFGPPGERMDLAGVAAYETLAATRPETVYVYGETGWPRGGRFRPHRTHRSGVSVDYMTPVTNREGRSVPLPTWPWLRFGYDMAFDPDGCTSGGSLCIDYPALAAHLRALHAVGHELGVRIGRVIFAPDLQAGLFAAASDLRDLMAFSRNPSWVRHDDHIHVDFVLREDG